MKKKWMLIAILVIIAVPNLPIIGTEILARVDDDSFRYSNANASFTVVEDIDIMRGWMDEWVIWGFIEDQRPTQDNMQVYRLYHINPLCFWRWRYYLSVSRKFDYKSWKEIEPNRVPFKGKSRYQHF